MFYVDSADPSGFAVKMENTLAPEAFPSTPTNLSAQATISSPKGSSIRFETISAIHDASKKNHNETTSTSKIETTTPSLLPITTKKRKLAEYDDDTISFYLPQNPRPRKKLCIQKSEVRKFCLSLFQDKHGLPEEICDTIEIENNNHLLGKNLDCWTITFTTASEEVKNALRYLSHGQIKYLAAFLGSAGENLKIIAKSYCDSATRYNSAPHPDADELKCLKKELLDFLAVHIKGVIACHDCEAVHSSEPHDNCASDVLVRAHNNRDFSGNQWYDGAACYTSFSEASWIMNSFRRGSAAYGKGWRVRGSFCCSKLHWISEEACDVYLSEPYITDDERLLVRHQHWYIINRECENQSEPVQTFTHWDLVDPNILCRHVLNVFRNENELFDWSTMTRVMTEPYRCGQCAMEFQVDKTELGETGWAVVVTAWRDFGRCRSVWDPRWQAHFAGYGERRFILDHGRTRTKLEISLPDELDDMLIDPIDEELDDMERGWREEEEEETSDLPLGGIRDAFEGGEGRFDLEDCMDEGRLRNFIRRKAMSVVKGKLTKNMQAEKEEWNLVCMAKLPQWGGPLPKETKEVQGIRYASMLQPKVKRSKRRNSAD